MRFSRSLGVLAACGLASLGLSAVTSTVAHAATGNPQAGPFEVGNLLDYANSDFEGTVGNWGSVSNATLTDDPNHQFLHNASLRDTATTAGTSSFKLGTGSPSIQINLTAGDTYRVGAYFKVPAASGQTVQFSLGCYDSSGSWIGWSNGAVHNLLASTKWQYSEDDITVPSGKEGCAYVLGSPKVTLGGLAAGAAVNMDEAIFAPYRAALIIGAHGNGSPYTASDWLTTNSTIGPLQSDKEFWDTTQYLPSQWNDSKNNCYEIEQSLSSDPSAWPACVIAYKNQETESQLAAFFTGLPAAQMVIMVWYQEPEGNSFSGCPGAASGNGPNFVCYFEQQSQDIRQAAGDAPNVFVAMDAGDYQYSNDPSHDNGTGCAFIPPNTYADFYLVDHYDENANGKDLPAEASPTNNEWSNWLACVQGLNKPLGLAEYGLDCTTNPDQTVVTNEMKADDSYLAAIPGATEPTIMWEYWYDGGCVFDNSAGGVTAWKSFETQNGGG